jgi:hypothetical protein
VEEAVFFNCIFCLKGFQIARFVFWTISRFYQRSWRARTSCIVKCHCALCTAPYWGPTCSLLQFPYKWKLAGNPARGTFLGGFGALRRPSPPPLLRI